MPYLGLHYTRKDREATTKIKKKKKLGRQFPVVPPGLLAGQTADSRRVSIPTGLVCSGDRSMVFLVVPGRCISSTAERRACAGCGNLLDPSDREMLQWFIILPDRPRAGIDS